VGLRGLTRSRPLKEEPAGTDQRRGWQLRVAAVLEVGGDRVGRCVGCSGAGIGEGRIDFFSEKGVRCKKDNRSYGPVINFVVY
jgi:hypothetical protein